MPDTVSEENVKRYKKQSKMRSEIDTNFNTNLSSSLCFFCWFLDESRGVFFLRFGGQSASNGDYFGTLLQLYYSNDGKLKTSVSPTPNTTCSRFEGGSEHLGQLFPTIVLVWILGNVFIIFL